MTVSENRVRGITDLGLVGQVHEYVQTGVNGQRGAGAVDGVQLLSVVPRPAAIARAQFGFGAPGQPAHGRRQAQRHRGQHGHRGGGGGHRAAGVHGHRRISLAPKHTTVVYRATLAEKTCGRRARAT